MYGAVDFDKTTTFLGRNGQFKNTGLRLYALGKSEVMVQPVTSKGYTGRCHICIPMEDIDEVISALQKIKQDVKDGGR